MIPRHIRVLLLQFVITLSVISSIFAQSDGSFYYYKGKQIHLNYDSLSFGVFSSDSSCMTQLLLNDTNIEKYGLAILTISNPKSFYYKISLKQNLTEHQRASVKKKYDDFSPSKICKCFTTKEAYL